MNNTATDGYKVILTAASQTPWTSITLADYNESNTTGDATTTNDATDGYQWVTGSTTANTSWVNVTESVYNTGNVDNGAADGWRTTYPGGGSWVGGSPRLVQQEQHDHRLDRWLAHRELVFGAVRQVGGRDPVGLQLRRRWQPQWMADIQVVHVTLHVVAPDRRGNVHRQQEHRLRPDQQRRRMVLATKFYEAPYTGYDATHTYPKTNRQDILGDLIDPSGIVDPIKDASGVINAEVANMYTTTAWTDVKDALKAIALGQCGGTLTLSTPSPTTTPANEHFHVHQ